MSTNFLPAREADLVTWSTNFDAKLRVSAVAFGLTAAQATAYTGLHDAFVDAYQTANNPDTRSPSNIVAKNTAKDALISYARELARIVQATPTVTDEQKAELGLTVRDSEPSPIPVPEFAPGIDVVSATGRTTKLRLHDAASPTRRGKPAGVAGASVYSFVGETAPADLEEWNFEANFTKTIIDIDFPAEVPNGSTVWFTAVWFNPRMETGPAATPVSTNLPGGLTMAA